MTWTKLPDSFNDDPDLLALARGLRLMHVEALVWSNAHGTDGAIPRHVLSRITDEPDALAAAEQLVVSGLWSVTDTGWLIAFEDQMPAAEVARRRADAVTRTQRWDHHRRDLHDLCLPKWCKKANALPNASVDASIDALPYRSVTTVPYRDTVSKRGSDREDGAAHADSGGAEPAVAAAPSEVRWLPLTADDYQDQEWRADYLRCERCLGLYPSVLFSEDAEDDPILCRLCRELIQRRRGKDCFAFTRPKKDAPSRPCRQPRLAGSSWCKYHERAESRGQAPIESRRFIDEEADKATAKLSSPKPELVEEPTKPASDGDAAEIREAVRLWLKHKPDEPVPETQEGLRAWLSLARHDLAPDEIEVPGMSGTLLPEVSG